MGAKRSFHESRFELIGLLEKMAGENPRFYYGILLASTAVGYMYILGVLGGVIALGVWVAIVAHGLAIRAALLVAALVAVAVRSLWFKVEAPDGIRIAREDAPQLFATLESLRQELDAPRIHVVLVTDEYSAAAAQRPRFGPFGPQQNFVILGMRMMLALPPEHYRSVLAHEYAHISRAHGRSGAWIYRSHAGWHRLVNALRQSKHWSQRIFTVFFDRYIPLYEIVTKVFIRHREYEADALAARSTSARTFAEALLLVNLQERALGDEFWPGLIAAAKRGDAPPAHLLQQDIAPYLRADRPFGGERIAAVLRVAAAPDADHPSFRDRMSAIGELSHIEALATEDGWKVPALSVSAAEHLFTPASLERLLGKFDAEYEKSEQEGWSEVHDLAETGTARLAELAEIQAERPLTVAEAYERADRTEDVSSTDDAAPLMRGVLAMEPDHVTANLWLGRYLLLRGDPTGMEHLERARRGDPDCATLVDSSIIRFLLSQGRAADATRYFERLTGAQNDAIAAGQERHGFSASDRAMVGTLPAAAVESLVERFAAERDIKRVYLVDKVMRFHPEVPYHVLCVEPRYAWYTYRGANANRALIKRVLAIVNDPPGVHFVVVFGDHTRALRRRVLRVPGALIYDRKKYARAKRLAIP